MFACKKNYSIYNISVYSFNLHVQVYGIPTNQTLASGLTLKLKR